MKQRTVTQRNVLGAFVGGMLGILAFGYFSNAFLLVLGVFVGIIGGWWYQEIAQATVNGYNSGVAAASKGWTTVTTYTLTPARRLKEMRFDPGPVLKFFGALLFPLVWLTRRVGWAKEHPFNRAVLLRVLAVLVFLVINAYWFIPYAGGALKKPEPNAWDVLGTIIGIPMAMLMSCMSVFGMDDGKCERMRQFYKDWARYANRGPALFFANELFKLFTMMIGTAVMLVAMLFWLLGVGSLCLAIIGIVSAVIGFVKGVYQASVRAGHWLCFGITLTTTAITAYNSSDYFGDIRILWAVALSTGVVSALITEGVRGVIAWGFKRYRSARAVALIPIGRQLRPSGSVFWKITEPTMDWFADLVRRPMQLA